jgi:hypothetical protein
MTTSTLGLDYFWTPIMAYFSVPIDSITTEAPCEDNELDYPTRHRQIREGHVEHPVEAVGRGKLDLHEARVVGCP